MKKSNKESDTMGTLIDWFKSRREASIIKETKEHAKKVYDSVYELDKTIKLFLDGKGTDVSKNIKKIDDLERECDSIRRKVMVELSKGELTPSVREDLAHLISRLDSVANNANATANRLGILSPDVLAPIADDLKKMSEITLKCVELLHKTIDLQLGETMDKVMESTMKINELEHDVDGINYEIKRKLINVKPAYSPYIAITVFDMVQAFEQISDFAEETADFIRIINVRS